MAFKLLFTDRFMLNLLTFDMILSDYYCISSTQLFGHIQYMYQVQLSVSS